MDTVYTDFVKAFSSVNHLILINVLKKLRFRNVLLLRFNCFFFRQIEFKIIKLKHFMSEYNGFIYFLFINSVFIVYR